MGGKNGRECELDPGEEGVGGGCMKISDWRRCYGYEIVV